MNSALFQSVRGLSPSRSVFDLSYVKTLTCDMGQLIPVMCDEVVPGDIFELNNQAVIRFQPLVAPILHEINMYVHYFFVPYRLLWDEWEDFITGGVNGDLAPTLPTWSPTAGKYSLNSLWDYFGFPPDIIPTGALPVDFPRRAYNFIYNNFYRDETLQTELALTAEDVLYRNWEKDYYTSALLQQQRGTAPALPISGVTSTVWDASHFAVATPTSATGFSNVGGNTQLYSATAGGNANALGFFNANTVDLSVASTFDIADLRVAFQIQKFLERNNRCGARYTEFLKAHFGVSPRDERLQRPEYIGGSKSPIIISEVLQTSSTDATSPQGNLAGHGITVSAAHAGKYHAQEFGLIMGVMSIMPRSMYQQGIDRQWLRRTKYDFYFREFANLSEQAVERAEIYATAIEADNKTLFGYQGRYNEMRSKNNMVVGEMRSTFDYWHLGREFSAAPVLNSTFIQCIPRKDVFAVPSVPGLIVSFGNVIKAYRPMPIQPDPGLIDHF